jgi:hypothetical protein
MAKFSKPPALSTTTILLFLAAMLFAMFLFSTMKKMEGMEPVGVSYKDKKANGSGMPMLTNS